MTLNPYDRARGEVDRHTAELAEIDGTLNPYAAELAQLEALLAGITIATPPSELALAAARRERALLLRGEIQRLQRERGRVAPQLAEAQSRLAEVESRLAGARAFVASIKENPAGGLMSTRARHLGASEIELRLSEARRVLRWAGEEVEPITIQV